LRTNTVVVYEPASAMCVASGSTITVPLPAVVCP
jgi:hypothetical protein